MVWTTLYCRGSRPVQRRSSAVSAPSDEELSAGEGTGTTDAVGGDMWIDRRLGTRGDVRKTDDVELTCRRAGSAVRWASSRWDDRIAVDSGRPRDRDEDAIRVAESMR